MDEKFLEFIGQLFLNAAKGKKQYEDMLNLGRKGMAGFEEMTSMYLKFCGLAPSGKKTDEYLETWNRASEEFRKSFKEYLNLMGVVPKEDYLKLVKRCEELKSRAADQEETIRNLQVLLGEKGTDQGETAKVFKELMEKQSEQFVEMMKTVGGYFKKEDGTKE